MHYFFYSLLKTKNYIFTYISKNKMALSKKDKNKLKKKTQEKNTKKTTKVKKVKDEKIEEKEKKDTTEKKVSNKKWVMYQKDWEVVVEEFDIEEPKEVELSDEEIIANDIENDFEDFDLKNDEESTQPTKEDIFEEIEVPDFSDEDIDIPDFSDEEIIKDEKVEPKFEDDIKEEKENDTIEFVDGDFNQLPKEEIVEEPKNEQPKVEEIKIEEPTIEEEITIEEPEVDIKIEEPVKSDEWKNGKPPVVPFEKHVQELSKQEDKEASKEKKWVFWTPYTWKELFDHTTKLGKYVIGWCILLVCLIAWLLFGWKKNNTPQVKDKVEETVVEAPKETVDKTSVVDTYTIENENLKKLVFWTFPMIENQFDFVDVINKSRVIGNRLVLKVNSLDKETKIKNNYVLSTQINENVDNVNWVVDSVDKNIKGIEFIGEDDEKLSAEDKANRFKSPSLWTKKYNWVKGDLTGNYDLKINSSLAWVKWKMHKFYASWLVKGNPERVSVSIDNFKVESPDQEIKEKQTFDKFLVKDRYLTYKTDDETRSFKVFNWAYQKINLLNKLISETLNGAEFDDTKQELTISGDKFKELLTQLSTEKNKIISPFFEVKEIAELEVGENDKLVLNFKKDKVNVSWELFGYKLSWTLDKLEVKSKEKTYNVSYNYNKEKKETTLTIKEGKKTFVVKISNSDENKVYKFNYQLNVKDWKTTIFNATLNESTYPVTDELPVYIQIQDESYYKGKNELNGQLIIDEYNKLIKKFASANVKQKETTQEVKEETTTKETTTTETKKEETPTEVKKQDK